MFNRSYKDMEFIPRWTIVRKIRTQFLAGHSYLVAMYANDICVMLGVDRNVHIKALQYALWHDMDEIISGDMPGPAKRSLVRDMDHFKQRLKSLMEGIFGSWYSERAGKAEPDVALRAVLIVKAADWLEAAMEMACEYQLGNRNVEHHMIHDLNNAIATAHQLCDVMRLPHYKERVDVTFREAVRKQQHEVSPGPLTDPVERRVAESLRLITPSS